MFVDGDDWCAEDCVEYMVNMIAETGAEMAMSDQLFTTSDMVQSEHDNIEVYSPEDAVAAILYPVMLIGPWNKIYIEEYKDCIKHLHRDMLKILLMSKVNFK